MRSVPLHQYLYAFAMLSSTLSTALANASIPAIELNFKISMSPKEEPEFLEGEMSVRDWHTDVHRHCFYLPYNDPKYALDPIKSTDVIPRKYGNVTAVRGFIETSLKSKGQIIRHSNHLIEVTGTTEDIRLHFKARPPRWNDSDRQEWMFYEFYPQILTHCPKATADVAEITLAPLGNIEATIERPSNWGLSLAAKRKDQKQMNSIISTSYEIEARTFAFAMNQGMNSQSEKWNDLEIEWVSHSDDFLKFKPALYNALDRHTKMFGPFPFPKLIILETGELQKSSIPGIVTVNRPRQAGLSHLQDDTTNWSDWQITSFSADQWIGAGLTAATWDELWLIRGLIDFATIEALRDQAGLFGLMKIRIEKETKKQRDQPNFDYRQSQDLLAAVLTFMQPYHALTDSNFRNLETYDRQYGLNYMRAALSLRQINYSLGPEKLDSVLRDFFLNHRGQIISSEVFADYLSTQSKILSDDERIRTKISLREWWSTSDWPDFVLDSVDEKKIDDGKYAAHVRFLQREGYSIPVRVKITDQEGKSSEKKATQDKDNPTLWHAEFVLDNPQDSVEIEPTRQVFDWNRFNNNNRWSKINIFPGNMKTFADDAYSVIWLPLASKVPGDDFTWLFVAQAFRYVQASMTAVVSYIPNQKRYGYSLYYLTDLTKIGSYTIFDVIQDRGRAYSGERVADAGIYKTFKLLKSPVIEYGMRLRHREMMSRNTETGHQTLALKIRATPLNQYGVCNYYARTELERLIHAKSSDENYHRDSGIIEGSCKAADWLEIGARGFVGILNSDTLISENLDFSPQESSEARLRIDSPQLPDVAEIKTAGIDILTPMPLPLPSAFFTVNRQMRFRMFYDYGESRRPQNQYRDAGVGLWIPFGGDVVGKGAIQILNLSILTVLYRQTNDVKSFRPGVVFDFDFFGKI